jgi:GTP cyclohydrolase I
VFHPEKLQNILRRYIEVLNVESAYLRLSFNYPILQESLRSGL